MRASQVALCSLILGGGMLLGAAAMAAERYIAGIGIAEQSVVAGTKLSLNGAGLRRYFGLKVYVAALYLPEPRRTAAAILETEQPRRLQLTLLREISAEQNLDAIMAGLVDNNSAAELQALQAEIGTCQAMLRGLDQLPAGSLILLDYQPASGTRIVVGDRLLGLIPGERFNRALLRIWLGEVPIQASLKRALLGAGEAAL